MKKNEENELMMKEIEVKNLREISGGANFSSLPRTGIPITTGAFHPIFLNPIFLNPGFPIAQIGPSFITAANK